MPHRHSPTVNHGLNPPLPDQVADRIRKLCKQDGIGVDAEVAVEMENQAAAE